MAIVQALLDDIDLRYKSTFTTAQKLVWMTEEQSELFEILEIDSPPVTFILQTDVQFYPIPLGVDIDRIKTMTIQINDMTPNPDFVPLPFRQNDDNSYEYIGSYYYTIVADTLFIPFGTVDDRAVYIYMDTPSPILDVDSEPGVPVRYQELLKLGTLKRIAAARKDIVNRNNYDVEYQEKIFELDLKMKMDQPEFPSVIDTLPRAGRYRTGRYDYRYFQS